MIEQIILKILLVISLILIGICITLMIYYGVKFVNGLNEWSRRKHQEDINEKKNKKGQQEFHMKLVEWGIQLNLNPKQFNLFNKIVKEIIKQERNEK
ncbi:hypothetical protein LCGC14_3031340 [marine sediment metagenome]|uniref:Uncharacterized protein n=1 Tax=marine sediment metagenome TaxID=412755 RepID=A0A0F8WS55_9ZZZZ